jgi:hypothetical protein
MNLEKAVVHEIHEKTRKDLSRQSTQRMLANGVSRHFAVWRKLTNDLSRDIAQWAITRQNSNRYRSFDIHLAGELLHRSKLLVYLMSFVPFVEEKRFLG